MYLDKKIIELKEYLEKCKKIEDGLKLELESKFITIDEVREKKNSMNKKLNELVLKIHPYAIKQMEGKDTRWFTTIKKEGEERKIIKKKTYEEIIDSLITFYGVGEKVITLRTLYPRWRDYKMSCTKKSSYIRRIEADWKAFYLNDPIIDVSLKEMTSNQITQWMNQRIIKDGVTQKKKFYNLITIFKNVFKYAYDENLIKENTFLKASYRKELLDDDCKPNDETQVFTNEEREAIICKAYEGFKEHKDQSSYLAIALLFQTGLRVGELVALEEGDYNKEEKTLLVNKSECRDFVVNKDNSMSYGGVKVGDPKKKASIRTIHLSNEACYILDTLIATNKELGQKDGDYIFVYHQKRLHSGGVLKKIYKLCDDVLVERRSTHKIRKTILSNMVNMCIQEGLGDISAIRKFAGHVDERTLLRNYVFSTKKNEMSTLVNRTFTSNAWKHIGNAS